MLCSETNAPPYFGYSVYKFTIGGDRFIFYLDTRDCDYDGTYPCGNDFYFKYNYLFNSLIISTISTAGYCTYKTIENGRYYSIWEINEKTIPHVTNCFEDFWSNCLVLIPSPDNHPRLIWGPYPESGITVQGYKVYRKYGNSAWQLRTTVSSSTYEYIDEAVSISPLLAGTIVLYKITAIYGTNSETLPTNIVEVNVKSAQMEKVGNKTESSINEFVLDQNHPNPFNPSTIINYSIKETGLVKIKVYDILGSVVAELVNESKDAGYHSVEFNASNLPSGIFIYTLQVNGYSDSKKMLLLK